MKADSEKLYRVGIILKLKIMANTDEQAVFGILDRMYRTILKIDDGGKPKKSGLIVSIQEQGKPLNNDDYINAWTPFLESGDEGDQPDDELPNPDTDSNIRSAYNAATLVDDVLSNSEQVPVVATTSKISTTWKAIMVGAQADPSQISNPTQAEKNAIDDANDLLFVKAEVSGPRDKDGNKTTKIVSLKSDAYLKYLECQKEYDNATSKYTDAYVETLYDKIAKKMWPIKGKKLVRAVENAQNDWNSEGRKADIEDALNTLGAQGKNPVSGMVTEAKNKFDLYQMTLGGAIPRTLPYTYISPSNWCDEDSDIWTSYTSKVTTSEDHDYSSSREWAAKVKVRVGLFKADASSGGKLKKTETDSKSNDTEISLKWTVVDINRPWMDSSLLNWSGWYLKGGNKNSISSDDKSNTYLPTIPTQMILVKDVVIKNEAIQSNLKTMALSTDSSLDVGYGPFVSVGGSLKTDDEKRDELKKMARSGLSFPGIQVIGWVSQITPSSPKMDQPKDVTVEGSES